MNLVSGRYNPLLPTPTLVAGNPIPLLVDAYGRLIMALAKNWSVFSFPATAAQATITKAAIAGVSHVCNAITASVACGATAQTPIQVVLRDGLTGAGTVLWTAALAAPANGVAKVSVSGLGIIGTAGNAMTLEFTAAGVAASQEAVTLSGYDSQ